MPHMTAHERALYVATAAAIAGVIANKGRAKPAPVAHRAQEFASAQVDEWRTLQRAERLKKRAKRLARSKR